MRKERTEMKPYAEMTREELQTLRKELKIKYREFQGKDLKLDMSRGKPSVDQLDLSMGMMDVLSSDDDLTCAVIMVFWTVSARPRNCWRI